MRLQGEELNIILTKMKVLKLKRAVWAVISTAGLTIILLYTIANKIYLKNIEIRLINKFGMLFLEGSAWNYVILTLSLVLSFGWNVKKINYDIGALNAFLENNERADCPKAKWENSRSEVLKITEEEDVALAKLSTHKVVRSHAKREMLRKYVFFSGGVGTLILLPVVGTVVFEWDFPAIVVAEVIWGYSLIWIEFLTYKVILNKDKVRIFSKEHMEIIDTGRKNKHEDMKYFYHILFIKRDRCKNHEVLLTSIIIASDFFAWLLTFLEFGGFKEFMGWMCLPVSVTSNHVAIILAVLSIILNLIDLGFSARNNNELRKIESDMMLAKQDYVAENYRELKRVIQRLKKESNLSFHKMLDFTEGTYNYNVEVLNDNNVNEGKKRKIHMDNMLTMEMNFTNYIQRLHILLAAILVVGIAVGVWRENNIANLPIVFSIAIILYRLAYQATKVWLYRKNSEWLDFELKLFE